MFVEAESSKNHFHALSAILGLAPTLIGTAIRWLQQNSKSKRRSQLTERLSGMTKAYTEQAPGSEAVLIGARAAMAAEIEAVCEELISLQAESKRTSHRSFSGWLSDAFLLFRPYGLTASIVHLLFYCGIGTTMLGLLGVAIEKKSDQTTDALIGFFFLGLLLLGLQRLAIWLRKVHQIKMGMVVA